MVARVPSPRFAAHATLAALLLVVSAGATAAQNAKPSENYDEMLAGYLKQAHAATTQAAASDGWAWMDGLAGDSRARRLNDLLSINVVESITASGSADSSLSKATDTANSIAGLFGVEKKLGSALDLAALANTKSDNNFKGSGSTNRAGALSAMLTARVADVLPNGDLVVEGVREIEINGDLQVVVLTGVVRVADISPANTVLSTSIGQLRIRYFGRGLMKDNLKPGFLLRILNKVF